MRKQCIWVLFVLMCCLTACDSVANDLMVEEDMQDYHFSVSEEDAQKVPYSLSGEADGWKVVLQVRQASEDEKGMYLQELEREQLTAEENYRVHGIVTKEEYQMMLEGLDRRKTDLLENAVYLSTLTGEYTGEQDIASDGVLIYRMVTDDEKVLLMGGIDLSSLQTPWYVARNTVDGAYAAGMFVPPQTGCTLILQYADEEVEIPLRLEQEKAE